MSSFARQWVRFLLGILALTFVVLGSRPAAAYPGALNVNNSAGSGYITSSTTLANGGCIGCHGDYVTNPMPHNDWSIFTVAPSLTIADRAGHSGETGTTHSTNFPDASGGVFTVKPGTAGVFTLTIHTGIAAGAAGFLLYHNDGTNDSSGTFTAMGQEYQCPDSPSSGLCGATSSGTGNHELMHSKPVTTANGTVQYQFQYNAPLFACSGSYSFTMWVNAVNADSNCTLPDSSYSFTFTINLSSCSDGNACNGVETCSFFGSCQAGTPVTCTASDQCHNVGTCNSATGICSNPAKGNGSTCSDGNACTNSDTCQGGVCQSGTATTCPASDQCHNAGTCDTTTGACSNPAKSNGAACSDGNACTQTDSCQGGVCTGSNSVVCTASDQCHDVGTCNTGNGLCSNPAKANGTGCTDGNACTQTDTCQAGACVGSNSVVCTASDQCHDVGTCNTGNGTCSNPAKANGSGCTDNNLCTSGDACQGGACIPGAPVATDDSNPCTTDACTPAGGVTHNPAPSGTQCSNPSCTNGPPSQATPASFCDGVSKSCPVVSPVSCNGQACSGNTCGGGCNGDDSKCIAGDFCSSANACTPKLVNGTACTASNQCVNGNCIDGYCCNSACGNGNTSDCQACNVAGNLGSCVVPVGTTCRASAGICDAAETCQAGNTACPADAPAPANTVCRASADGNVCDPAETCGGAFTCPANTATRNGQACPDDGNACSVDVCANNACTHSTPAASSVTCRGSAGPCDPAENCDGTTTVCPSDTIFDNTHVCRPAANGALCDVAEVCPGGNNPACPADGFAATTVNCRPASCSGSTLTQAANCPGTSGACPGVTTKSCSPYLCGSTTACATSCNVKTDCTSGNYCNTAHQCVPELNPGGVCSAAEQCGTGICVDGRCCNSQCNGQCQACDVAGVEGTCSPIKDKVPHGTRTKCVGDGSACQGFCDGTNTASCALPGSTTQCRDPSCTAGVATAVADCTGTGSCPPVVTLACAPGICQAATGPKAICVGGGGTPCTADVECSAGHYCVAGTCKTQNPDGTVCGADDQCTNGHCVDGLCCNSSCDGQCEACDVNNSKGKCTPVADKPHGGRPACVSDSQYPTCAGVCDGKNPNACTFPGPGTSCRDASCTKGAAVLPASCTGTGTCSPEQDQACPADCAANGKICDNGCITDRDCPMNQYCSAGVCVPTLGPGAQCSTSSQCVGACVDGYCCNTACDHQCEACNVKGKEGVCTAVSGAPVGLRQACSTDGTAACAGKCDGSNRDSCAFPGGSVQCSAGSCADGVATLTGFCDGEGSCPRAQNQICAPADCSGTKCGGDCATTGTCPAGNFCSAGVCKPVLNPSTACASDAQCAGGNCVDGYCCNSKCDGQCQACDVTGAEGTCTTLTNDLPHGGRAACQGLGACAATCDGTNPSACTYAGMAVACGKPSCALNGEAVPAPQCNGAGVCLTGGSVNCGSYTCDAASGNCLTTCIVATDCAAGFDCVQSKCIQSTDGGIVDAGTGGDTTMMPDASMMTDASVGGHGGGSGGMKTDAQTDAQVSGNAGEGGEADGGLVPPGHSTDKGSCGCSVPGSESRGTNVLWLAGLALVGVAVRRRRRAA